MKRSTCCVKRATLFHQPQLTGYAQVLTGLASDEKLTASLVPISQAAFGDHPYGTNMDGTVDSVNGLTREDIIAAHQAIYKDRIYVGAVEHHEELGPILDELFGDLRQMDRCRS